MQNEDWMPEDSEIIELENIYETHRSNLTVQVNNDFKESLTKVGILVLEDPIVYGDSYYFFLLGKKFPSENRIAELQNLTEDMNSYPGDFWPQWGDLGQEYKWIHIGWDWKGWLSAVEKFTKAAKTMGANIYHIPAALGNHRYLITREEISEERLDSLIGPISFSEKFQITCSHCGEEFFGDVWLVINMENKPSLLEHIKSGEFRSFSCPKCEHIETVMLPFLLYFPSDDPQIVAFVGKNTHHVDKDHTDSPLKPVSQLGMTSAHYLYPNLYDDLRYKLSVMEIPASESYDDLEELYGRIENYPEMTLKRHAEIQEAKWQKYLEEHPEIRIALEIQEYLGTSFWWNKKDVIEEYPELLTEKIEQTFETLISELKESGETRKLEAINVQLEILRTAREIGFDKAVDKFQKETSS